MRILVLLFLLIESMVFAAQITITQPGQYGLGDGISFTPTANDSAILIQASDVFLDLKENIIEQVGGGAFVVNGIEIAAGVSNVTITNGTIRNFTNNGIIINQNCSNIRVSNMQLNGMTVNSIRIESTTGNPVRNCFFSDIIVNGSLNGISVGPNSSNINIDSILMDGAFFGIIFFGTPTDRCRRAIISNVVVNNCFLGIDLRHTDYDVIRNCQVRVNSGTTGISVQGVVGTLAVGSVIEHCNVENSNSAVSHNAYSLTAMGGTTVRDCVANTNSASGGAGFVVQSSSAGVLIQDCSSESVSSQQHGFATDSDSASVLIKDCQASGASTANFFINSCSRIMLANCVGSASGGAGFFIGDVSENIILQDCISTGNVGIAYSVQAVSRVIFESCIADLSGAGGFILNSGSSCVLLDCQAQSMPAGAGFASNNPSSNCIFIGCTSSICNPGFTNSGINNIFASNSATHTLGGAVGFNNTGINARYFLNSARYIGGTNYVGAIATQVAQGAALLEGANLSA